jgi:hypothetical protein
MRSLDALGARLGPARIGSIAAGLLALLILAGFGVTALKGDVHTAAWVVAAGLAVLTVTGLLYAWRLGAYEAPR